MIDEVCGVGGRATGSARRGRFVIRSRGVRNWLVLGQLAVVLGSGAGAKSAQGEGSGTFVWLYFSDHEQLIHMTGCTSGGRPYWSNLSLAP